MNKPEILALIGPERIKTHFKETLTEDQILNMLIDRLDLKDLKGLVKVFNQPTEKV